MALLKFRAVVVLPLPFKWSGGPSKGEGGGCRSVVLIHRLTDLKTREAALLTSKDERGSSSEGESSSPLKGESSSPR